MSPVASVKKLPSGVGEVIRNETDSHFHWIDYEDYMPKHPELQRMIPDRTVATCAFLEDDRGAMSMPLNKIARFIDEGPAFISSRSVTLPR